MSREKGGRAMKDLFNKDVIPGSFIIRNVPERAPHEEEIVIEQSSDDVSDSQALPRITINVFAPDGSPILLSTFQSA